MQKIPQAKKVPFSYTMHGETILDPYQWLEDRDSATVRSWVKKQNTFTKSHLVDAKFEAIKRDIAKDQEYDIESTPSFSQGYWYLGKRGKRDQKFKHYRKKSLTGGKDELYFDENTLPKNTSLQGLMMSSSKKYIAYQLSDSGSEHTTIYVKNLETGQILKDKVPIGFKSSVSWNVAETGFYYNKPDPKKVTKQEPSYFGKLYFHKLGTSAAKDQIIFGHSFHKEFSFYCNTKDDTHLLIYARKRGRQNHIFLFNIQTGKSTELLKSLIGSKNLGLTDDYVFMYTNAKAPRGKILIAKTSDLYQGKEKWKEIIPQNDAVLQDFSITSNAVLCIYLSDVSNTLIAYDFTGKIIKNIPIPPYSTISTLNSDIKESIFSYSFENFLQMRTSVVSDSIKFGNKIVVKPVKHLDPALFKVEQRWYKSGNARVPMYILRRKDVALNGNNPTVLHSYGGYGTTSMPHYLPHWEQFIKSGGIYVLANIRGGGEFGEDWHRAGSGKNKLNSLHDIIAAAEFLQKELYTSPRHLAIFGGSNGGMNVLACMVMRPELFGAVISAVPVSDMYRFPQFLMASRWVHEKGDPRNKEDFQVIKKWSPYHNVAENIKYPPLLITTGYNDSRVHPMHSWKMTARMQEVSNKTFLYTDLEAGHIGGAAKDQQFFGQALKLRFLKEYL